MTDTKENILHTALSLFAKHGYEAVSVSTIAGQLGITKGALYKHYKCKRDILDCIVQRMVEVDAERARRHEVPEKLFSETPEAYSTTSWQGLKMFTEEQFIFWTTDEFAGNFRKMIALEQYRDTQMMQLYQNTLANGPVSYLEDLFREMMKQNISDENSIKLMAIQFYAPLFLLLSIADSSSNIGEVERLLLAHTEQFINYISKTIKQE